MISSSSLVSVCPPPSSSLLLGSSLFPHQLHTSFVHRLLPQNHSNNHNWNWQRNVPNDFRYPTFKCSLAKAKDPPSPSLESLIREPHKYFDQVIITVRAGDGGHGATLSMPNPKAPSKFQSKEDKVKARIRGSYKRDFDGSLILPMGGHGGDVVIYADEGKDSLLEFHKKGRYNAKRGGNVDTMGVLTSQVRNGLASPTLRIPVPLGTVVKHKRGKFLADLARHGDEILVARGGQGGISLIEMPEHKKKKMMAMTANVMRDENDKVLVIGQHGEEVSLQLILRVVADVGLVGLPNAGKSTLLSAITLAKPDIADYPFTTLMPNLGRLEGDPSLGAGKFSSEATLADLPGLIEGAHLGKGLGRNFLRHLRRTRMLVHVVDASTEDPVYDYRTVKEELRMYNPEYLERPYLVVLNKIDIPEAMDRLPFLVEEIQKIGSDDLPGQLKLSLEDPVQSVSDEDKKIKEIEEYPRPVAVVGVSVLKCINISELLKEIRSALRKCRESGEAL
ncbi:probable GTP-binding protein OBGC2 [Cynara cardunculus var. scolymus]|uniref:probable GTP-binding protein OBGC2 n=1 Tax=Cynara cardunculus var. scolymus TaxID=59895 RepID=UPI000D630B4B|nr:probable GTP-binding protein OBGC2 [Cynara cardunculus var. scolymus]